MDAAGVVRPMGEGSGMIDADDLEAANERSTSVAVRAGHPGDVARVTAIDTEVTGLAKPEYWRDLFGGDGERRHFFVAEDRKGRVIGFAIGEVRAWEFGSPPCGWVFAITVDPATRQAGIGSRLLAALVDRFREEGVGHVRTMISRGNHELMSFFRSQGMMAGPYIQLEMELAR